MPRWNTVEEFPEYKVSDEGQVVRKDSNRLMVAAPNQYGFYMVGLNHDGLQVRRGLALLVARAFVHQPFERFDTPIHLDLDRSNCKANNLMWRPRWYAVRYHQQDPDRPAPFDKRAIRHKQTGRVFSNTREAARTLGLVEGDIAVGMNNLTYVPPTYDIFELAEPDRY